MNLDEYTSFDGLGLAELVRKGEVQPKELVQLALTAMERVNPRVNAIIRMVWSPENGEYKGSRDAPFAGVPFLIKDLLALAGFPMTMGSRLLKDYVPPANAPLMDRYLQAGLVTLGKTNLPEFGMNVTTEPVLFGPSKNPWNLERSTGGSSGGSAAAVAARVVPIAHGNDGGGSIRIPASCCGVFGFKPTSGRTSANPQADDTVDHALTRSVRDSAALLDATMTRALPRPPRPYLAEVGVPPGRLRIAYTTTNPHGAPVDAECVQALERTVRLCQELGHELVEVSPQYPTGFAFSMDQYVAGGISNFVNVIAPEMARQQPCPDNVETVNLQLAALGSTTTAVNLISYENMVNAAASVLLGVFDSHDLLLTPTLARTPVPLGELNANAWWPNPLDFLNQGYAFSPFCALVNMSGQPAMSVPLHQSADGLPIGMHFIGRYADEATLFRLAGQLERAAPWAGRRPPVCASASRPIAARRPDGRPRRHQARYHR
jgi:amidase